MAASLLVALTLAQAAPADPSAPAEAVTRFEPQGYVARFTVEIAAPRERVWAAATGDVTGWWDHSMFPDPEIMRIEPAPGGRFLERPSADGDDGTLHATVIHVQAPRVLRLHGPLGLSGRAFDLVTTWTLEAPAREATQFSVELRMAGEIDAPTAAMVRGVWTHFIEGRLKPFVEAGCDLEPEAPCAIFETGAD